MFFKDPQVVKQERIFNKSNSRDQVHMPQQHNPIMTTGYDMMRRVTPGGRVTPDELLKGIELNMIQPTSNDGKICSLVNACLYIYHEVAIFMGVCYCFDLFCMCA